MSTRSVSSGSDSSRLKPGALVLPLAEVARREGRCEVGRSCEVGRALNLHL